MPETQTHALTDRFAWMIEWFCKLMAAEAYRRPAAGPFAGTAWNRMHRLNRRFAALVAQWRAGTLPAIRPARPRPTTARAPRPSTPNLLRGFNWFRKLFPDTAAPLSGHLHELLHTDADIPALAAATPQAGRLLRPMCWMVGIKPPAYLQLPRRPRRPRPARKPKERTPRQLTPEQVDAKVARMSRLAFANLINPEREPMGWRPPNRIGYARPRPWPKRS